MPGVEENGQLSLKGIIIILLITLAVPLLGTIIAVLLIKDEPAITYSAVATFSGSFLGLFSAALISYYVANSQVQANKENMILQNNINQLPMLVVYLELIKQTIRPNLVDLKKKIEFQEINDTNLISDDSTEEKRFDYTDEKKIELLKNSYQNNPFFPKKNYTIDELKAKNHIYDQKFNIDTINDDRLLYEINNVYSPKLVSNIYKLILEYKNLSIIVNEDALSLSKHIYESKEQRARIEKAWKLSQILENKRQKLQKFDNNYQQKLNDIDGLIKLIENEINDFDPTVSGLKSPPNT